MSSFVVQFVMAHKVKGMAKYVQKDWLLCVDWDKVVGNKFRTNVAPVPN